jgi:hypothetical protein
LLAHGVHDYAIDLATMAGTAGLIPDDYSGQLRLAIKRSIDASPFYLVRSFTGVLFAAGIYVLGFPLKSTRQRVTFYLQQRVGHFSRILARTAGRSGPSNSCIAD